MPASESSDSDYDLDDVPLTLDSRYLDAPTPRTHSGPPGRNELMSELSLSLPASSSNFEPATATDSDVYEPLKTSRGNKPAFPKLALGAAVARVEDMSFKKLPRTPEVEEPLPSSRAPANPPAFRLSLPQGQGQRPRDGIASLGNKSSSPSPPRDPGMGTSASMRQAGGVTHGPGTDSLDNPEPSTSRPSSAATGAGISISAPATSSGSAPIPFMKKPPRLNLPNAATASPTGSPLNSSANTPLRSGARRGSGTLSVLPTPLGIPQAHVTCSLMSPAYALPLAAAHQAPHSAHGTPKASPATAPASSSLGDLAIRQFMNSLGVPRDHLRAFQVREISLEDLARSDSPLITSGGHIAFMVNNNSFSLRGLEELLAHEEAYQTQALTISRQQEELTAAHKQTVQVAVLEKENQLLKDSIRQLEQRLQDKEREMEAMRTHLQRCDEDRHKMRDSFASLRKDFGRTLEGIQQQLQTSTCAPQQQLSSLPPPPERPASSKHQQQHAMQAMQQLSLNPPGTL